MLVIRDFVCGKGDRVGLFISGFLNLKYREKSFTKKKNVHHFFIEENNEMKKNCCLTAKQKK
jgi:hypothetical protein